MRETGHLNSCGSYTVFWIPYQDTVYTEERVIESLEEHFEEDKTSCRTCRSEH